MRDITALTIGSTASAGNVKQPLSVTNSMVFRVLSTITRQVLHSRRCSSRWARSSELAGSSMEAPNSARKAAQLSISFVLANKVRGETLSKHQSSPQNTSFKRRNAQFQHRCCFFRRKLVDIAQKHGNPIFLWQPEDCYADKFIHLRGGQ